MRFYVKNNREMMWVKDFADKNNFIFASNQAFWPSTVVIDIKAKVIDWLRADTDSPFIQTLTCARNKEVMLYEDGVCAGPFKMPDLRLAIGEKVRIKDTGYLYTTYWKWFVEQEIDTSIAARYRYMDKVKEGQIGRIVAAGPHIAVSDGTVYAVELKYDSDKSVYLINEKGVEALEDEK